MSKISREDNKKRFKTGMYPTQQDFENVFDSYVHKDDTIDPSKIVSGDENIVDIINRKAEERHSHEIADVNNLGETLQQIQDDLDTAEDNIAGHETRIVTLEAAKTDYEAFKERVRAFLEDANASDTTIDRWHEIENFLQGITDTETLTGLLNDLKQEILREIPEPQTGNYLELVDDLDAYSDAPDGKIVKYVGQTNEKYTRGFDYERVVTETTVETLNYYVSGIRPDMYTTGYPSKSYDEICEVFACRTHKAHKTNLVVTLVGNETAAILEGAQPGSVGWRNNGDVWVIVQTEDLGDSIKVWFGRTEDTSLRDCWQDTIPKTTFTLPVWQENDSGRYFVLYKTLHAIVLDDNLTSEFGVEFTDTNRPDFTYTTETETTTSWQPIPSFNVIN